MLWHARRQYRSPAAAAASSSLRLPSSLFPCSQYPSSSNVFHSRSLRLLSPPRPRPHALSRRFERLLPSRITPASYQPSLAMQNLFVILLSSLTVRHYAYGQKRPRLRPPQATHGLEVVKILVGPEKKEFTVHQDLLCALSPFFVAALKGKSIGSVEHLDPHSPGGRS